MPDNTDPTTWRRRFSDYAAQQAALAEAEVKAVGTDFTPRCLDCAYDLTGLDDGRCPECGHHFTLDRLVAAHHFRINERKRRLRNVRHLPLLVAFIPLFLSFGVESYIGFAISTVLLLAGGISWYALNRDRFIEGSAWLLVLFIPLLSMFAQASTMQHGLTGMAITISLAAVIAGAALRGSPLIASGLLIAGLGIPVLFAAAIITFDGVRQLAVGHHWSNFDYPSFPRWRAFAAAHAIRAGIVLGSAMLVVAVLIALVARRAFVRLRNRDKLRAAKASAAMPIQSSAPDPDPPNPEPSAGK